MVVLGPILPQERNASRRDSKEKIYGFGEGAMGVLVDTVVWLLGVGL